MHTALHIAGSGLRHAQTRQRAAAHNAANLTTGTSVVQRVAARERAGAAGGVDGQVVGRVSSPPLERADSAVNQATEQITTRHYAAAQGNVVRTADDMLGSLLEVVG